MMRRLELKVPDLRWHMRNTETQLKFALDVCTKAEVRDRWRRERFWRRAGKFVSVIGSQDRFGNDVLLSTSDPWVSRLTFVNGTFDGDNLDSLVKVLTERDLIPEQIIDIGANIGTSTLELLSVFPNSTAVSVEPHPGNFLLLQQNILANGLGDRVRAVQAAVGDHDGMMPLVVNSAHPGDHRIGEGGLNAILVPMKRLVDLVTIDRPSLLWLDVQGYEGHVLRAVTDDDLCPALVEFWPKGLQAAGGYEDFLSATARYGTVLEAQANVGVIDDLRLLGERLEAADAYTDLLLLP